MAVITHVRKHTYKPNGANRNGYKTRLAKSAAVLAACSVLASCGAEEDADADDSSEAALSSALTPVEWETLTVPTPPAAAKGNIAVGLSDFNRQYAEDLALNNGGSAASGRPPLDFPALAPLMTADAWVKLQWTRAQGALVKKNEFDGMTYGEKYRKLTPAAKAAVLKAWKNKRAEITRRVCPYVKFSNNNIFMPAEEGQRRGLIRGIKQVYDRQQIKDPANMTRLQIDNYNIAVMNHIRALFDQPPMKADACAYNRAYWTVLRRHTVRYNARYKAARPSWYDEQRNEPNDYPSGWGPCMLTSAANNNLKPKASDFTYMSDSPHCGSQFVPDFNETVPNPNRNDFQNEYTSKNAYLQCRDDGTFYEGRFNCKAARPWSVRLTETFCGTLAGESPRPEENDPFMAMFAGHLAPWIRGAGRYGMAFVTDTNRYPDNGGWCSYSIQFSNFRTSPPLKADAKL